MQTCLPAWPRGLERNFTPIARLLRDPERGLSRADRIAMAHARRVQAEHSAIQCSGVTGTWSELLYSNTSDFAAFASSAAEGSLITPGPKMQPVIPALFFDGNKAVGRGVSILARGLFSNTGTPTQIFQVRMGTTQGASNFGGASIGVSSAITGASGITNKWWELRLDLICTVPGQGTGNATIAGAGYVSSPGGFASPFVYPLEPTTPDTATWTQTFDNTLTQFLNLSLTWSASSASNTITTKFLQVWGWN